MDEREHVLQISDIYNTFTDSTVYNNMSKLDKRKYTLKYFNEKIKTNLFLQNYYKSRGAYINCVRYNVPILTSYKFLNENNRNNNVL